MDSTVESAGREVPYKPINKNLSFNGLSLGRHSELVTRVRAALYRKGSPELDLNTICPYYTMFPLDFPLSILKKADKNDWVLDPFCGRGTTIFAARMLGLGSVGIDSNPVAAAISAAKLVDTEATSVIATARSILGNKTKPVYIPNGEFWKHCYHPETLKNICVLRESFMKNCSTPAKIVLRALMLGILHGPLRKGKPTYLSNQMPRTYAGKPAAAVRYWQRKDLLQPPYVDVLETIINRANHSLAKLLPPGKGAVYCGDARYAALIVPKNIYFNWIITSPPYFGMRTYKPDQWLRNWFLGGRDCVDYNNDDQLPHSREQFVAGLAQVWRSTAEICRPGARLIIRFGCLPSEPVDAFYILKASLKLAGCGWQVKTRKDAGSASNGNRQSEQFKNGSKKALPEFDLYARLEV